MNIDLYRPKRRRNQLNVKYPNELQPGNIASNSFGLYGATKNVIIDPNLSMRVFFKNEQTKNSKNINHAFALQDGIYTYVIYIHNELTKVRYCAVAPLEIGTKHFHICSTLPTNASVLIAGELKKSGNKILFNYESGSYSKSILYQKGSSIIKQLDLFVKEVLLGLQGLHGFQSISQKFFFNKLQGKQLIKTNNILIDNNISYLLKTLPKNSLQYINFKLNNNELNSLNQIRIKHLLKSFQNAGLSLQNSSSIVKNFIRSQRVAINQTNRPKKLR